MIHKYSSEEEAFAPDHEHGLLGKRPRQLTHQELAQLQQAASAPPPMTAPPMIPKKSKKKKKKH